ncbi:MAG: hypothetical protein V3S89_10980 [Desulfobacterales bacterium]
MTEGNHRLPPCFGDLDTVFPMGTDGLRHTPKACYPCEHKTLCLRSAWRSSKGLGAQEEFVDRAYTSGLIGFLERWSKKKDLERRRKNRQDDENHSRR